MYIWKKEFMCMLNAKYICKRIVSVTFCNPHTIVKYKIYAYTQIYRNKITASMRRIKTLNKPILSTKYMTGQYNFTCAP